MTRSVLIFSSWLLHLILIIVPPNEGLFIPYEIMEPAKNLLGMWLNWYDIPSLDNDIPIKRAGDPCDVPEEATRQVAYLRSVFPKLRSYERDGDSYKQITLVAQHLHFYKSKVWFNL